VTASFDINAVTLDWLRETHPDIDDRLTNPELRHAISALTQASRFLTRLLVSDPLALDVVDNHEDRTEPLCGTEEELARWKRLELLRIATRDITGIDRLEAVGARLARLADDVLESAARLAGADDLVIVGMGKLGGRELNYSSDIDVMFVGRTPDATVREVMRIARQSFRVDAALRPEGRSGALVRSVESYRRYWEEAAQPWEFQALLKARVIHGPIEVTEEWSTAAYDTVWKKPFGPEELRQARQMKAQSEALIEREGHTDREVKRGRGGIRDIEFAVQLLQLVHGAADTSIRSPTTLTALAQLAAGGYIATEDADSLSESYRFLRTVEHRLQLVEEQQTHLIPTDRTSRDQLAAVLGHRGPRRLEQFEIELRRHQTRVRSAHERLYFRPLLEAFASGRVDPSSPMVTQLTAFGFTDAERTRVAVEELTRGLARSSKLMQQLMPLLFDWMSASPDPDEALLGLRTLISGFRTPSRVVNTFRDSPESARRLCMLLGTSRLFSQGLLRHPELVTDLGDDQALAPREPIVDRLRAAMNWRESEDRNETLLRLTRAEQVRISASDVLGIIDDEEAALRRTDLAEAVLTLSLEALDPPVPVALIAMGRFGGAELSYVSDLDVVVVHGGQTPEAQSQAETFAQLLLKHVANPAPTRHLYPLDYDLRPEGKNGVLARSIEGCIDYYSNWAQNWERQALVRARPIAGDPNVIAAFMDIVDDFVWKTPITADAIREIRILKARMETERIPRNEDPTFHLKLGPGSLSDIEWTVQFLQLQHRVLGTRTLGALARLRELGHIDSNDADLLEGAWRFCDQTRNRLFLVNNGPANALPTAIPKLTALARSLERGELREDYKKFTRRSRDVVERLFYGRT
jgi:glutamate-ammonia-ligase adenylyltransferase